MKKLLVLAVFGLVGVMVIGAVTTGAWFTDTGAVNGGQITTGSLDLLIDHISGLNVANLEPGVDYVPFGRFCAKNNGNYDMKWHGWLTNGSDPQGLGPYLQVQAIMNPAGLVGNYGPAGVARFTDVPVTDLYSDANNKILLDPSTAIAFKPGHQICYELQVKLSSAAKNAQQLGTFKADLTIVATQWINSGWAE